MPSGGGCPPRTSLATFCRSSAPCTPTTASSPRGEPLPGRRPAPHPAAAVGTDRHASVLGEHPRPASTAGMALKRRLGTGCWPGAAVEARETGRVRRTGHRNRPATAPCAHRMPGCVRRAAARATASSAVSVGIVGLGGSAGMVDTELSVVQRGQGAHQHVQDRDLLAGRENARRFVRRLHGCGCGTWRPGQYHATERPSAPGAESRRSPAGGPTTCHNACC